MIYGNTPFQSITGGPLARMSAIADPNHRIDYPEQAIPKLPVSRGDHFAVTVPPSAMDSMQRCLMYRREQRLTIPELLQHEFLRPRHQRKSTWELC
jgi:serine/threonine-protein kinase TTK/MPS1